MFHTRKALLFAMLMSVASAQYSSGSGSGLGPLPLPNPQFGPPIRRPQGPPPPFPGGFVSGPAPMKQYSPSFPPQSAYAPAPIYRPTVPSFSPPPQYYGGSNGFGSFQQIAPPSFQSASSQSFGVAPPMGSGQFAQQMMPSYYPGQPMQLSYGAVPPMVLNPPPMQKPFYGGNTFPSMPSTPVLANPPSFPPQQQFNPLQGYAAGSSGSSSGLLQNSGSSFPSPPPRQQQPSTSYGASVGPSNEGVPETSPTYGVPPQQQQQQLVSPPSSSSPDYSIESNIQQTPSIPARPQAPADFLPIYSSSSLSGTVPNSVPASNSSPSQSYENNNYY